MKHIYTVTVYHRGGHPMSILSFRDEKKARDHYTDMLMMYPTYNVELFKSE